MPSSSGTAPTARCPVRRWVGAGGVVLVSSSSSEYNVIGGSSQLEYEYCIFQSYWSENIDAFFAPRERSATRRADAGADG
jgi:hypothetical protein